MTREEAIKVLEYTLECVDEETPKGANEAEAIPMAIEALQTDIVRCEEREWIDTEEEMPIDSQEVIANVYWTDYGDTTLAYGHYNARFDTWKLSDLEGELIKGYEVVAWMPMPHPYTADRKAE